MGLFSKTPKPDKRILRLDDQFTTAAKNESSDPEGTRSKYRAILSDLNNISSASLSPDDQGYLERLKSILARRIEELDS